MKDLSNDDNAIAFLQELYEIDKKEAEQMLQSIDILCEDFLELANEKFKN